MSEPQTDTPVPRLTPSGQAPTDNKTAIYRCSLGGPNDDPEQVPEIHRLSIEPTPATENGCLATFKVVDARIDARPGNSTQQRWVPIKTRRWRVGLPASSFDTSFDNDKPVSSRCNFRPWERFVSPQDALRQRQKSDVRWQAFCLLFSVLCLLFFVPREYFLYSRRCSIAGMDNDTIAQSKRLALRQVEVVVFEPVHWCR